MKKEIEINFKSLDNITDFYHQLEQTLDLPKHFGNNLDALYDCISGDLEMPLHFNLINVSSSKRKIFQPLFLTLEEAEEKIDGFSFSILTKEI